MQLRRKYFLCILSLIILLSCLFTACGASRNSTPTAESYAAATQGGDSDLAIETSPLQPQDGRKVIVTTNITLQTLAFDKTCEDIKQAVQTAKGYTAESEFYAEGTGSHNARYVFKIPVESYDAFIEAAGQTGNIFSFTEQSEDITATYVDIEARLNALRTQESSLLTLMEQATSLDDIIKLQEQLTTVRYEIESYTAQLRTYDQLIAYCTVTIHIQEVVEYEEPAPETYGSRVSQAFSDMWRNTVLFAQNFSLLLIAAIPLIIVALLVLFIVLLVQKKRRKKAPAKQNMPTPAPPVYNANLQSPAPPITPSQNHTTGTNDTIPKQP